MICDFHCHSNFSDGTYTYEEIMELAKKENVKHLSIVDHDVVGNPLNAFSLAKGASIYYVHGIELSAYDFIGKRKVHILGYGCNWENETLLEHCQAMTKARNYLAYEAIEKISQLGYNLSIEDFNERLSKGKTLYKQHLMEALMKKGYCKEIYGPLFHKFSQEGIFKELPYIDYLKALALIKEAKGIAVLAHIGIYRNWDILETLVENGLDGLEVFHFSHDSNAIKKAFDLARKYDLLMTGGTDFHGGFDNHGAITLGIESNYFQKFIEAVRENEITK